MAMPYKGSYWVLMSSLARKYLIRECGRKEARRILREAKAGYRQMLEEVDDIGVDNPMAHNIYMAFPYLAIWRAAGDSLDLAAFRRVVDDSLTHGIVKAIMQMANLNRPKSIEKLQAEIRANRDWVEAHPQYQGKTWDVTVDDVGGKSAVAYHFTVCPLNTYARRFGYLDALPVMCELDHLMVELEHGKLHREGTLALGSSCCDYWISGDQRPMDEKSAGEEPR